MRILYGVQGTGNGHLTRARVMAERLAAAGVATDYLISGRPREALFGVEPFADFTLRRGLTFAYHQGRVDLWQTLRQADVGQLWRDVHSLDLRPYDLVITDFEPVTAWAAKRRGVPSIALSHQAGFRYSQVPRAQFDPGSQLVMSLFAPAAEAVGLHWHHFDGPLLPPVIDTGLRPTGHDSRQIVVYLPFEEPAAIRQLLQSFGQWQFLCFHPDAASQPEVDGPVHWQRLSRERFPAAIAGCGGIIANSGFELPSEALHLGKKLLVKPLAGQFEQVSNALALRQLGLAHTMERLDPAAVAAFLQAPSPLPRPWPDVAAALARWLAAGGEHGQLAALGQQLWQTEGPRVAAA